MERAVLISLLLCVSVAVQATHEPPKLNGNGIFQVITPTMGVNIANNMPDKVTTEARDQYQYHPAAVQKPRLLEQFDKRFDDGHYEYSYTLSNGDRRYEHAYWQPVGKNVVLARKGYYSYPLPNNKFLTVFYTSDQNGFQQELSSYTSAQPTLPRTLDVPQQVYIKPQAAHVGSYPVHHSDGVSHVGTTPAPTYVLTNPHHNKVGVSHGTSTPAPEYVVASPAHVGSYVQYVSGVPGSSYVLTSSGHHPWGTQFSQEQSRRAKRSTVSEKSDAEKHLTTTQSSIKVPSTTHESHQQHVTPKPIVVPQSPPVSSVPHVASYTGVTSEQLQAAEVHSSGVHSHHHVKPSTTGHNVHFSGIPSQQHHVSQTYSGAVNPPVSPGQSVQGGNPTLPNINNPNVQNALLAYLASKISAESPESYSSESNELFWPGLIGTNPLTGPQPTIGDPLAGVPVRRRLGNRPIWRNQHIVQPFGNIGF